MTVIVVEEETHGDIAICANMRSAFKYLIEKRWLEAEDTPQEIDRLMAEYEKDNDFLDGHFYFHEVKVYNK